MDVLVRIKRLVLRGRVRFTRKAQDEMDIDDLTADSVIESIVNAQGIDKVLRSKHARGSAGSRLYVIKSYDFSGEYIYTKGGFGREEAGPVFYVLVSAKIARPND